MSPVPKHPDLVDARQRPALPVIITLEDA